MRALLVALNKHGASSDGLVEMGCWALHPVTAHADGLAELLSCCGGDAPRPERVLKRFTGTCGAEHANTVLQRLGLGA